MTPELFIITTPNDPIRQKHLEQQLFTQKGIDDFKITYWPATMNAQSPQVGISHSHRSIVQKAKDEGRPEVIIGEDDLEFLCPNSLVRFLNLNLVVPKDTNMLMGGIYDGQLYKEGSIYSRVVGRMSGLQFYVVRANFYDQFLSVDPALNLDYALSQTLNEPPVIYCADPFLVIQVDGIFSYNRRGIGAHNYGLKEKYSLAKCE